MSRYLQRSRQCIGITRIESGKYTHLRNIYVNRRNAVEVIAVDVSASEGIVTEV